MANGARERERDGGGGGGGRRQPFARERNTYLTLPGNNTHTPTQQRHAPFLSGYSLERVTDTTVVAALGLLLHAVGLHPDERDVARRADAHRQRAANEPRRGLLPEVDGLAPLRSCSQSDMVRWIPIRAVP